MAITRIDTVAAHLKRRMQNWLVLLALISISPVAFAAVNLEELSFPRYP